MSLRLGKLEKKLGLRLFERGRYNFKLTAAGGDLLPDAQAFVDMHDRMFGGAQAKLVSGAVRLGVGEGCGFDLVAGLLRRVQAHYPNIRFSIRCGLGHELRAGVEAGECELAIVALPEPVPSATVLSRPRLHWVARPDFAFREAFRDTGRVVPGRLFLPGCRRAGRWKAAEIAYYEVLSGPGEESIQRAVQAGIGITVMAEGTVPGDLRVIVRPSVLPRLGSACIQLLGEFGPAVRCGTGDQAGDPGPVFEPVKAASGLAQPIFELVGFAVSDHVGEAPGHGAGCGKIRNGGFDPGQGDSVGPREMIARRRHHHAGNLPYRRGSARRGAGRRFRAPLAYRPFAADAQASPEPLCAKTAP